MKVLLKKFFFIIQFLLYYIKSSETIPLWKDESEVSYINGNRNSYSFDGETGAEIYLINGNLNYYSPTTQTEKNIKIPQNITNVDNLIEIDSTFYFSINSQIFAWIDNSEIKYKNPEQIKELSGYKIKCLRDNEDILVAFLGTEYLFWFNSETKEYIFNYTNTDSMIFLGINYYSYDSDDNEFIVLSKKDNNYKFNICKKSFGNFQCEKERIISGSEINIYDNKEIITTGEIAYIFSYDSDSSNFSFYLINLAKPNTLGFIDGKYYFRFFNDFKIKYAKFIKGSPLLYYSIEESLKKDKKSYIGVADLRYYLLLYNIEENVNDKLYFFYGNGYNNQRKLFYFKGKKKILLCPFIKNADTCTYDDNSLINITQNEDGFFINEENDGLNCQNKRKLGNYCVKKCAIGYYGNDCNFCPPFDNGIYYYATDSCGDINNCHYTIDNSICYNCKENKIDNRTLFYEMDCIEKCEDIYGQYNDTNNDSCVSCKSIGLYFSLQNKICVDECKNGGVDEFLSTCEECEFFNKLYFPYNRSCVEQCNEFLFVAENNICHLCNDNNRIYQDGKCVDKCDNREGYGFDTKIVLGNSTKYCLKCINDPEKRYLDGENCVVSCPEKNIVGSDHICIPCPTNYHVDGAEVCVDECPSGTSLKGSTCIFCDNKTEFYYEGKCLSECGAEQYFRSNYYINNENHRNISYRECLNCEPPETFINGKCRICTENFYSLSNEQCFACFCGDDKFNCTNTGSQCNCSLSSNYYGDNCEFYSEIDINTKSMKIISLNNRLIKTSQNYFSYELTDGNDTLSDKETYEWKLFINNKEITGNKKYQKFFITSINEPIFGINKDLFKSLTDETVKLSLNISNDKYYDIITLKLIKSFEYSNECLRGKSGSLGLYEMGTLVLQNNKVGNNQYNGRYLSQYRLLDYNNEKIPITNFIELDNININLICSKGFDINSINDREEVQESSLVSIGTCTRTGLSIDNILEGDYLFTEKIYLLISNLINKGNTINYNDFKIINNFINKRIPEIINVNGYYLEENNTKRNNNIRYSEPKLLFSLINNLASKSKEILTEEDINYFFNYTYNIFEIIFKEVPISNKTLSESDIKSLFRTIDNLYDICIEKDFNSKELINNFVETFNSISKYLSYKTYPSETIRLIGNRISVLSYHLGAHQKNISFPFIDNIGKVKIDDFLTYSYDNYFLNEEICSQRNSTLFCFTQENYNNIAKDLKKKNYNLNDIFLNIYLLQEINRNNEIILNDDDNYGDDIIEKITINKNYSLIVKLFKKENNGLSLIQDNLDLNIEVEFPFGIVIGENEKDEEKEERNNIFSDKKYFKNKGWDIPLSPNNSEFTCIPKSFYENKANNKYFCYTHFDYDNQKVRCSCQTQLNDEILIIKDQKLSETFKYKQFHQENVKFINKYSLLIIYLFIFILLIPIIYFIISDLLKENNYIKTRINTSELNQEDNELKANYNEIKKYSKAGIFKFSFNLSLIKFPFFSEFNMLKNNYQILIRYLIICDGFFIGIVFPLIPFYFVPFSEKQIFMDQRDINYDDENHKEIKPDKYLVLSIIFSLGGIIFGNLFIYIFYKVLKLEKEEVKIWGKIKELCKDYVYNKIKSEVLLGSVWKKIKYRLEAYYYICGKYIMKNKNQNDKFTQYLNLISGYNIVRDSNEKGPVKNDLVITNDKVDINIKIKNNKLIDGPLFEKDEEEKNLLDNNNIINNENEKLMKNMNRKRSKYSIYSNSSNNKKYFEFNYAKIIKSDSFILDNNIGDKSKKKISKFEKIKIKYIYASKKRGIEDEIFDSGENKEYQISKEINFSYLSMDSFDSINDNKEEKEINKTIYNYIIISAICFFIFILLLILILVLLRIILERFGTFILKTWLVPALFIVIVLNYLLYFAKIAIGTFLLFHCYHLRNRGRFFKILFWIFVDKTMIYKYKIRNFITKYQKEFNYL